MKLTYRRKRSRKVSRRKSSRKASRKASRKGSRKASRKKSRKASRKKSRKASRKKSRKGSRKKSRKVSRKKYKKRSSVSVNDARQYRALRPGAAAYVRRSRNRQEAQDAMQRALDIRQRRGPQRTIRIYIRNLTGAIIGGGEYDQNSDIRVIRQDLEEHGVDRYTATSGQLMYNGEIISYAHRDKSLGAYATRMGFQPNQNGVIMLDLLPSVVDNLVNLINTHLANNHQQFINLISNNGNLSLSTWKQLCDIRPAFDGPLFRISPQGGNHGMCVDIIAGSLNTTPQQLQADINNLTEYKNRVNSICNSFRFKAMIRSQLPDNLIGQLPPTMRGTGRRIDVYP